MKLELADRLELLELPGRYGDAIDDRNWDNLKESLQKMQCST